MKEGSLHDVLLQRSTHRAKHPLGRIRESQLERRRRSHSLDHKILFRGQVSYQLFPCIHQRLLQKALNLLELLYYYFLMKATIRTKTNGISIVQFTYHPGIPKAIRCMAAVVNVCSFKSSIKSSSERYPCSLYLSINAALFSLVFHINTSDIMRFTRIS